MGLTYTAKPGSFISGEFDCTKNFRFNNRANERMIVNESAEIYDIAGIKRRFKVDKPLGDMCNVGVFELRAFVFLEY